MARIVFGRSCANATGTKPQRLRLGDWYCEPVSWADAMARVARALLDSIRFRDKLRKNINSVSGIGAVSAAMRRPVKLEKNLWLEANKSAQDCLRTIAALLKAAEFPLDTAAVEYEEASRKEEEASEKVPPLTNDVLASPSSPSSAAEEPYSKGDSVALPSSSVSKLSEESFVRYVAETSTDNNARKCRTGIWKISRILADMGLVKSSIFEIGDIDELQSATAALRENTEYLAEDKRCHRWLRSPLNHYLRFAETVLCNRSDPVHPQPQTNPAKPKSLTQVQPSSHEIPASGKRAKKKAEKEPYTAYPKHELFAALAEDRIPDEDFDKLLTLEGTRAILGMTPRHDTPVFSLTPQQFFWHDPATRRGCPVFVTGQWFERDKARLDKMLARWRKTLDDTPSTPDMKRFLNDIREHWPEGFDFSDGAMRLLEGRCGKIPRGMVAKLKDALFHLRGRLWIVPDAVAPKATIEEILREADSIVADAGFASIARLAKSPFLEQSRLVGEKERTAFVEFVLSTNGRILIEHGGKKFAVPEHGAGNDDLRCWCGLVREAVEKSCAISYVELTDDQSFGNVDDDSAIALLREFEPDVIPELDSDGTLSFKMLSDYFLPDDFGTTLGEIVKAADGEGTKLTAAAICTVLSTRYGCDFAQDYALDPAYSLKWVVDSVWRKNAADEPRRWDGIGARARFVQDDNLSQSPQWENSHGGAETRGGGPQPRRADDLPSQVESAFSGVFSNDDFWRFSTESYGLASTREAKIAQLGYLAPRFIRLDRDRWISVKDFHDSVNWDGTKAGAMAEVLQYALGSAPMLPMATLGSATLDALPEISYRWTTELAASVAALLCPGCHVANHGTSPFAVTALLVPRPIALDEVVRYALGIYAARNPHGRSVEGAFEFLKTNNIRFRLTKNCRVEIETFLAKETL